MPRQDKCFSSCRQQPKSKCTTSRCSYTDGEKYKYCRLSRKYIMSKTKDGHCITQKRGHKRSLSEKTQSAKATVQLAKATIQDFILKSLKKPAYKLDKAVTPKAVSPDNKDLAEQKIGKFILNAVERRKREKIIKAELDARQKTIEKVRHSMFRHKIGKFMRNTTQKRRTEFLKAICSDSSVCIAFGREDKKIQAFFGGFDTFDNVVGPIKRIGTPSQNGFIHEIQYSKGGYNAFAILKSSANASGDNLFYEYMVGRYLNHLCKLVPCFVETYGLFTYDSEIDWRFAKNHAELPVQRFKNSLTVTSLYNKNIISKSCKEALLMSVLIQHIKGAETLGHKITELETTLRNPLISHSEASDANIFAKLHLPAILYQVYNPLARFANTFTHYDLHQDNVLLYVPNADKYIHYHYHIPGGTVTEFKSHYLAKIIDYGRSYFKDTLSRHTTKSSAIYKAVCQEKDCPNCGERNGYFWLNPTIDPSNYIGSQQRNASHDLRLLKTIIDISTRLLHHNPELNDWLKNKLKFDKHYGTPEVPAGGLPARIVNVLDADMVLDAMINTPQYKIYSDLIYSDPKWSKLGDLHVYSDGRPMNFVPTTYKIS